MLSRVADSFYWVGRYLERAEHVSRVLSVHISLTLDDPTDAVGRSLLVAVGAMPSRTSTSAEEAAPAASHLDPRYRTAVATCVGDARENGRQIREQISSEMWEQLNRMYLLVREAEHPGSAVGRGAFLRAVIDGVHQFHGVTEATLSRGEGWQYLELGRYLERATSTASLLEAYFNDPAAANDASRSVRAADSIGLLRACAAFEPYCRVYTNDVTPERLAEFLLLDAEFPRSVRFAIDRLEDALRALARLVGRQATGTPERYAGQLRAALNYGQIDEIMADNLIRYVQSIRKRCDQVHDAVYQTYIHYAIETAIPR
jgi:uncharacterized alpha-E superfamily protein